MITELNEQNEKWDEFLFRNKHLLYHTPEWKKLIENSFNIKLKYFSVEENDKIEFIFPIGIIKSTLFGNRLISVPYLEYGGCAGNPKHIQEIVEHIRQDYSNYNYLQVREGVPEKFLVDHGFFKLEEAKRFILRLEKPDDIWNKLHKMKRKAVRRAQELNVIVKNIPEEEIEDLYKLYLDNMKRFGSPAFPLKYFNNFYSIMTKNKMGKCFGAYLGGKLIASLLGFTYKDKVHINISVSYNGYLDYRPNDLLHWEFIRWAAENDYKIFDFGIVREETGQFSFKEKWNTELKPLNNYYLFLRKKGITNLDHKSPKFKMLESVWKNMPDVITNNLGPKIRKGLGI